MQRSEHTIPDASVLSGWRKSSYSDGGSSNCLEVTAWRKSSYSGASSGDCLEDNDAPAPTLVPVRDSKHPTGPAVVFSTPAWAAFVGALKTS
ncbi:DUF397 domain-containing protein [Streptomyces sp. NPDC048304]|uniref:DUF397 domain-containing protein n=1 Tax=Streptomyces sp. NPDC048304 TaxID=3154820 RepID=UPI0033E97B9F